MLYKKILCFFCFFISHLAQVESWPIMENQTSSLISKISLNLAISAFQSNSFILYKPLIIKENEDLDYKIIFGGGNSQEDLIQYDEAIFSKTSRTKDYNSQTFYWQKNSINNRRFVIRAQSCGFRGDRYILYNLNADLSFDDFLNASDESLDSFAVRKEEWTPPFLFQHKNTFDFWAIDFGPPYEFLADWKIFNLESTPVDKSIFLIHFRPSVKSAFDLLPEEIKKLALLLDKTFGPDQGQMTYRPNDKLKTDMQHTWSNVILRPWALSQIPYNTRLEVDHHLKKWSQKNKSFAQLYQNIQACYPKAQANLEKYYQEHLRKTREEAHKMAHRNLDIAFRSNFIFAKK